MKNLLKGILVGSIFLTISVPKASALSVDGAAVPSDIALESNGSKQTLTINSDVSHDIVIENGEDVTLVLASNATLSNKSGDTIYVSKGGKLTIEGTGTITNATHGKASIFNNGNVTIGNSSSEVAITKQMDSGNTYYAIVNHGDIVIEKADIKSLGDGTLSSLIDNGYYTYTSTNERLGYVEGTNSDTPTLTINGGTFTGGMNTVKNDDNGILTINGGTFKNTYQVTIMNWNKATVNGGTFDTTNNIKDKTALYAGGDANKTYNAGELTINGGTYIGEHILEGSGDVKVSIKDGTFKYTDSFVNSNINTANLESKDVVAITGGTYALDDIKDLYSLEVTETDNGYVIGNVEENPDDKNDSDDNTNDDNNVTDDDNKDDDDNNTDDKNNDDNEENPSNPSPGSTDNPNNNNTNNSNNSQISNPQTGDNIVMYGTMISFGLGVLAFITKKLI